MAHKIKIRKRYCQYPNCPAPHDRRDAIHIVLREYRREDIINLNINGFPVHEFQDQPYIIIKGSGLHNIK